MSNLMCYCVTSIFPVLCSNNSNPKSRAAVNRKSIYLWEVHLLNFLYEFRAEPWQSTNFKIKGTLSKSGIKWNMGIQTYLEWLQTCYSLNVVFYYISALYHRQQLLFVHSGFDEDLHDRKPENFFTGQREPVIHYKSLADASALVLHLVQHLYCNTESIGLY